MEVSHFPTKDVTILFLTPNLEFFHHQSRLPGPQAIDPPPASSLYKGIKPPSQSITFIHYPLLGKCFSACSMITDTTATP